MNNIGDAVLYKNNQLIAFNKPAGIPVQKDPTEDKCLLDFAEIYCKSKLHLVNRIDRPTTGIVLFAKSSNAMTLMTKQFQEKKIVKYYLAVVANLPAEKEGKLVHYIQKKTKGNSSIASEDASKGGELAEMEYRHIGSIDRYHLLEIKLITGKHHQIRAQLAAIGCPIKGDTKYGFGRSNKDRSIHLHSKKISFTHPVSNEPVNLTAPVPNEVVWNAFNIEK
ncbi:MAG: RluA family pseudouridine synthase [Saprospiraceae bacterium]|nr:RluA family pseudouridine synthase [Saprospiraceae bacterium]